MNYAEFMQTLKDMTFEELANAYLSGADLTGANLSKANLTGADLREADLTGAEFTGADLTGAQFTYNQPDWQTAYFALIADLRENEPEAYKRCRRRIIEKFEAENETIVGGVSIATLQKLFDGADWRNGLTEPKGFTKPRIINPQPPKL